MRDLTNQQFNHLTAIKKVGRTKQGFAIWLCECVCGNTTEVRSSHLRNGNIKSCGCKRMEVIRTCNIKHGESRCPEWYSWQGMKKRCYYTKDKDYHNYGARGIKVCDRWLNSYENFLADMSRRTTPEHTIDRIDCNGNYDPSNCKWSTRKEQAQNQRRRQSKKQQIEILKAKGCDCKI